MKTHHTTAMTTPSRDLYNEVRANFLRRGTSLAQWCKENKILRQSARLVLLGHRNGPKAQALRQRLIKASKAKEFSS